MIDYISGILISKSPGSVVIESNGIGYKILITLTAFDTLPAVNDKAKLFTHLYIKDNPMALALYGFVSDEERECFKHIISVSGIGPKTAINVISAIGYVEFTNLILNGNAGPLTSISGIGKKTAERLLIELKDKFSKSSFDFPVGKTRVDVSDENRKVNEVYSALISLGHSKQEAENMFKNHSIAADWKSQSVEEIIKEILRGK
jgi:holliday junction DNA helicase RuvA